MHERDPAVTNDARGFVECETAFPKECRGEVLEVIGGLYEIEARGRDGPDEERQRLRQSESKKLTTAIEQWAMRTIAEGPAIPGTLCSAPEGCPTELLLRGDST
ncbi:MAG: transposase [Deltaproteobacteria bacterium]|nr:transposase [Deltaproteobacteria bacterium]